MRVATRWLSGNLRMRHISIHATHAGGDTRGHTPSCFFKISIHATHAGGDVRFLRLPGRKQISIHATHAGGDRGTVSAFRGPTDFNPRHPCGWRPLSIATACRVRNFNPRHPCGWRLPPSWTSWLNARISIHATHAGGDFQAYVWDERAAKFQSTPPMRVATLVYSPVEEATTISIHATHAGGDGAAKSHYSLHA